MNKKISVGVAVSIILIAIAITFTVTVIYAMRSFDSKVSSARERASMFDKLSEIDNIVRPNLYHGMDDAVLSENLARGYVAGAGEPDDVRYLTAADISARNAQERGTMVGAGVEVEQDASGYVTVSRVIAGSSAESEGLQEGDVLLSIGEQDVLTADYETVSALLTDAEGTELTVRYSRDGAESEVILVCTSLELPSVDSKLVGDIYYINIHMLCATTAAQFETAVKEAVMTDDIAGIVVDMRGRFGGYSLEHVANMLDILLPTGTMVTGTYVDGVNKVLYTSNENSVKLPVAVLVDGGTTGYAELFAAVMADSENGLVVGTPTAGDGALRQLYTLGDGSGVEVTVAMLKSPRSETYHDSGVLPDYIVELPEGFVRDDTPSEALDPQLAKAAEAIRAMA